MSRCTFPFSALTLCWTIQRYLACDNQSPNIPKACLWGLRLTWSTCGKEGCCWNNNWDCYCDYYNNSLVWARELQNRACSGGRLMRWLNLALDFFVLSLYRSIFLFQTNVCFCGARFSFFSTIQETGWKECLWNDLFCCQVGRKIVTRCQITTPIMRVKSVRTASWHQSCRISSSPRIHAWDISYTASHQPSNKHQTGSTLVTEHSHTWLGLVGGGLAYWYHVSLGQHSYST